MELDHVILADVVSPRPDGKLDMYGVGWDTIYTAAVPTTHPRMDLVVRFLLTPQEVEREHAVTVSLITADGATIARIESTIAAVDQEARERIPVGRRLGVGLILTMASVVFPVFGSYSIHITWDGTEVRQPITLFVEPHRVAE